MSRLRLNKIATPGSPAASKGELFYSSTLSPAALAFVDESGNICRVGGLTTKDYRRVRVVQHVTGDTSHTPTSGVSAIYAYGVGGGGSGAGAVASSATTKLTCSVGGGGGAFAAVWLTTAVAAAMTIAVGDGGAAATAGANNGNAGGDTTLADTGAVNRLTAKGGGAGQSANGVTETATGTTAIVGTAPGTGGVGGAASSCVGDTKIDGGMGGGCFRLTGAMGKAGDGGNPAGRSGGQLCGPTISSASSGSTGTTVPTTQFGAGSTGAIDTNNTARASLKAAPGVLLIEEYA
jgi:hypothetical protein